MKIENPISTIRKAIKGTAETEAENEFLDKPEERHYKESLSFYRSLKDENPKMYENMILTVAKGVDFKNEMGNDLYKLFTNTLEEITTKNGIKIEKSLKLLEKSKKLTPKELDKEILELNKELVKISDYDLRNDSRLTTAFSEKKELLEKTINYISSGMLESIENEK